MTPWKCKKLSLSKIRYLYIFLNIAFTWYIPPLVHVYELFGLDESLFVLKENAGHYSKIGGNVFNYLTPNTYNSNDVLERQISNDIKYKLENYCSLDIFREQYEIKKGQISVEIEIGWHETIVNVNWPIIISKGNIDLTLNEFSVSKKDEFGLMNAVAGKIVNKESYDQNSIFKGEEFTVRESIEPAGQNFYWQSPFS